MLYPVPCLYRLSVIAVDNYGISAQSESVGGGFAVEEVFHVIWGEVHLVLSSFYQHLQLYGEFLDIGVLSVEYYFIASCCDLKIGKIAAQSLKIPVSGSVDFNGVDCFKLD